MNCRKVTHLLSAYLDGELPGVECLQIRDHLRQCEECAAEYDDLLSMKRLLGRLKIQEPAHTMAAEILQSIRIDSDLRAERSPYSRFQQLVDMLRITVVTPRILGMGCCAAIVAALAYSHSVNGGQVHYVGAWDHTIPQAGEFTAGVRYANPDRFVQRNYDSHPANATVNDVAFPSSFNRNYQAPSQYVSGAEFTNGPH